MLLGEDSRTHSVGAARAGGAWKDYDHSRAASSDSGGQVQGRICCFFVCMRLGMVCGFLPVGNLRYLVYGHGSWSVVGHFRHCGCLYDPGSRQQRQSEDVHHGHLCRSRAPLVGHDSIKDIRGTVSALTLGTGQYAAAYTATVKNNQWGAPSTVGGPWHDVLSSLAVPSNTLFATYYDRNTLATPKAVSAQPLDWSRNSVCFVTQTSYSVRWEGFIQPAFAGSAYTFTATIPNSGCQSVDLWVQNQNLNMAGVAGVYTSGTSFTFDTANAYYDFKLQYYTSCGGATNAQLKVTWSGPPAVSNVNPIDSTRLFQRQDISLATYAAGGLFATYWAASAPGGTVEAYTIDQTVGSGGTADTRPHPLFQLDQVFSARWYGYIRPSRWNLYTFYFQMGAGSADQAQATVDGNTLIPLATGGASGELSGTYYFREANAFYPIEIIYESISNVEVSHTFRLKWENAGG